MHAADWNDSQKAALVQQIVTGSMTLQRACAAYGVSPEQLKDWVRIFRRSVRQALDQQLRSTLSFQGLELDDLSHAELCGNLADLPVADLLQTIQMGRKDAHITITHAAVQSHLWCQAGEIIDATCGALEGEDAVYRILALERGSVVADFSPALRERRITISTQRILLEAVKHNDEQARLLRRIGDVSQVFSVVAAVATRHAADLDEHELAVLSSFDGMLSLDSAVARSGVPATRALGIVGRFFEAGLLAKVELERIAPEPQLHSVSPSVTLLPMSRSLRPERPPFWVLAMGALLCSSLGAVTAIAYADVVVSPAPGAAAAALERAEFDAPPAPRSPCPAGMVLIEGGKFFMGSDSSHPALAWARPAHAVNVDSFCLDTREVSVEAFSACNARGQCAPAHQEASATNAEVASSDAASSAQNAQCNTGRSDRLQHPQNCVSFHQASGYCAALGARLPTEAEWELAARGTENRLFPWGNSQPSADHVNACGTECGRWHGALKLGAEEHALMYEEDDGYAGSAPVGSFPLGSTPDGVLDLIGNVFEWTAGGLYTYDRSARINPVGPVDGESYVIRGGNFNSGITEFSDPALRFAMDAAAYSHGVGFRCAADPRGTANGYAPQHATRSDR